MKKLPLVYKKASGLAVILVIVVFISAASWMTPNSANNVIKSFQSLVNQTNLSGKLQATMLTLQMSVKDYLISNRQESIDSYRTIRQSFLDEMNIASGLYKSQEQQATIASLTDDFAVYDSLTSWWPRERRGRGDCLLDGA